MVFSRWIAQEILSVSSAARKPRVSRVSERCAASSPPPRRTPLRASGFERRVGRSARTAALRNGYAAGRKGDEFPAARVQAGRHLPTLGRSVAPTERGVARRSFRGTSLGARKYEGARRRANSGRVRQPALEIADAPEIDHARRSASGTARIKVPERRPPRALRGKRAGRLARSKALFFFARRRVGG